VLAASKGETIPPPSRSCMRGRWRGVDGVRLLGRVVLRLIGGGGGITPPAVSLPSDRGATSRREILGLLSGIAVKERTSSGIMLLLGSLLLKI